LESLNQNIFLIINSYVGESVVNDFIMISLAKYTPYIFIILLVYLWFFHKKNEALYSTYSAILGVAINFFIGLFYFHPRPFMDNLGSSLLFHTAENSFPSDHTTFVFSISLMLLSLKSTRNLGILMTLWAFLSGVGRVYCGVHYPFDILGSFVVAFISVIIVLNLVKGEKKLLF